MDGSLWDICSGMHENNVEGSIPTEVGMMMAMTQL
jgi:hypothetical protein